MRAIYYIVIAHSQPKSHNRLSTIPSLFLNAIIITSKTSSALRQPRIIVCQTQHHFTS